MKFPILFSLILSSCAGQQVSGHRSNQLEAIAAHQVSVKVSLDLAKSAFIAGCTQANHAAGIKKVYFECEKLANEHVKIIEEILLQ